MHRGRAERGRGLAGVRGACRSAGPRPPSGGRRPAARTGRRRRGLTYFRVRVTVENRGTRPFCVHLEDGQIDVRTGPDGESAFIDWRNSQFIEGFDVYPLRRVTAVLYAAGAEAALTHVDVQVQLRYDEEWAGRRLWTGGIGVHEAPAGGAPAAASRDTLSHQVTAFLREQAEEGTA
ncbi:hypothetical protein SHKM778_41010 [Streptomyces sp. KM77-8]|uniref:Uncharacterized protein n=1 Tax=Streptomyces haneummycinicus TaxID=3074435 RepID=A0AAT9HJW6_9ACTN